MNPLTGSLSVWSGIGLSITACISGYAQAWMPTGFPSNRWAGVACSADAAKVVGGAGGQFYLGQVYTSVDSGTNWSATSLPSLHWTGVASSADGMKLAAVAYGDGIYTSTNSGANWTSNNVSSGS